MTTVQSNNKSKCPACGSHIDPDAYLCLECGSTVCYLCRVQTQQNDDRWACDNNECDICGKPICLDCAEPNYYVAWDGPICLAFFGGAGFSLLLSAGGPQPSILIAGGLIFCLCLTVLGLQQCWECFIGDRLKMSDVGCPHCDGSCEPFEV